MRLVLISLFLTIFLAGCFDNFPGSDDLQRTEVRGTSVTLTNHCQTLAVIEPEEVRKHELPFVLKGFRDECLVLVEAPLAQFANQELIYYQCTLMWDADDDSANQQMEADLDTLFATPQVAQLINDGDLDYIETATGDVYRTMIFYLDEDENPHYLWTQEQLWSILTATVDNLKDLQWRFDMQYSNPSLCSEPARWGINDDHIFVDNIEKCYDGTNSRLDNYIFNQDGTIISINSEPSDRNFCSSN